MLKSVTQKLLRKYGLEIVRRTPSKRSIAISRSKINLVIDVGANIGQYGDQLRSDGYRGMIVSFEPLSQAFSALQRKTEADEKWTAHQFAIGHESGYLTLNVAGNSDSSSLLPMLERHASAAPESRYVDSEVVKVVALDELLERELPATGNIMLKIDTQGYEANVLRGASELLSKIEILECELSLVPLYEGQVLFEELFRMIRNIGFQPIDFNPVFTDASTGHCLQVDGLFSRSR